MNAQAHAKVQSARPAPVRNQVTIRPERLVCAASAALQPASEAEAKTRVAAMDASARRAFQRTRYFSLYPGSA